MSEKQKQDAINYDQQLPDSVARQLTKSLKKGVIALLPTKPRGLHEPRV